MHDNEQYFFEALKAGASGYVLKRCQPRPDRGLPGDDAGRAVPLSGCGQSLGSRLPRPRQPGEAIPEDPLTPRELEVVKLIAEGLTSEEIAESSSSARRPSIAIARISWRSSGCATASS